MNKPIKPNKTSFIATRTFFTILTFLFIFSIAGIALSFFINPTQAILMAFVGFIILTVFIYITIVVSYKKKEYTFYDNKIIQKGGMLFSDSETELLIKNITHVRKSLPFIQNKLFKTGNLSIEAAGSSSSEVHLFNIDNTEEVYEELVQVMKNNGFNLSEDDLRFKDKPVVIGVLLEVFKGLLGFIFFLFIFFGDTFVDIISGSGLPSLSSIITGIVIILLLFGGSLVRQVFVFLDLLKRRYYIYKEVIVYKDGFLTKNEAFIPLNNLSDSSVTQSFIGKIFGIYDIKLSCQGGGNEILFNNLRKGKQMSEVLDNLINEADKLKGEIESKEGERREDQVQAEAQGGKKDKQIDVIYDTQFEDSFKMNVAKSITGLIAGLIPILLIVFILAIFIPQVLFSLFALVIIFGILFATSFIQIFATTYYVKSKKIIQEYKFLSNRVIEFSTEKITGMVVKRNFIDKFFGAITIQFNSIGSNQPIVFKNIKYQKGLINNLLAKIGIYQQEKVHQINADYSFIKDFKGHFYNYFTFFFFLIVYALILIFINSIIPSETAQNMKELKSFIIYGGAAALGIWFLIIMLIKFYSVLYYKRTRLKFFSDSLSFRKGYLFVEYYYTRFENVKDATTIRYPLSDTGDLKFNLTGELLAQSKGNQRSTRLVSNNFVMKFVDKISIKDELLDYILEQELIGESIKQKEEEFMKEKDEQAVISAKPSVAQSVLFPAIFLIVIDLVLFFIPFFFIPALVVAVIAVIIIILIIINVKARTYIVSEDRILEKSGVIFKKQTSIIYDRVDYIEKGQGMGNKIFKTGNVVINTTGSSFAELTINNIQEYLEFYEEIKKRYER